MAQPIPCQMPLLFCGLLSSILALTAVAMSANNGFEALTPSNPVTTIVWRLTGVAASAGWVQNATVWVQQSQLASFSLPLLLLREVTFPVDAASSARHPHRFPAARFRCGVQSHYPPLPTALPDAVDAAAHAAEVGQSESDAESAGRFLLLRYRDGNNRHMPGAGKAGDHVAPRATLPYIERQDVTTDLYLLH